MMTLTLPDGGELTSSNGPATFSGTDRLIFVAGATADYRLVVRPRRAVSRFGGCVLKRSPARPATERDQLSARAARIAGEGRGELVGPERRLEKAGRALKSLESALALYERAGDERGRADTIFAMALVNGEELGRKSTAIALYENALALFMQLGDPAGQAAAFRYLGDETRDLDSVSEERPVVVARAEGYFSRAVELDRRLGDNLGEAATLTFRCRLYNDNGRFQEGLEDCRAALRLGANLESTIAYRTYMNLASLASNSGDNETAQINNRIALERLALVRDYVSPAREAFIKTNVGWLYLAAGDRTSATNFLRDALRINETLGRTGQTAKTLVALATIALEERKLVDALQYAQRAVDIYRRDDPGKIQAALNALGNVRAALGDRGPARQLFSEAIAINQRNGDRYAEADSLYNLAKLEAADGKPEVAVEKVRLAVNRSEIIRAKLYGQRQRTSYLSILRKFYELESDLLSRLYASTRDTSLLEQAWQANEKLRARALLENLIEGGLDPNTVAPEGFYKRELSILESIAAAELMRNMAADDAVASRNAGNELIRSIATYDELREQIRRTNPRFSALNDPPEMSADAARAMLDGETAVLEFVLGEPRSGVWVFRREGFHFVALAARSQIEVAARDYYKALTTPGATAKTVGDRSAALSRLILAPVADELRGRKRIVVMADGILQTIPFAALSLSADGVARPLTADFEIAAAPSFATIASIRENRDRRPADRDKTLAVFADPVFQRDDERLVRPRTISSDRADLSVHATVDAARREVGLSRLGRLPFSAFEASKISSFASGRSFVATGVRASRESFLNGEFGSYRILHFATHGFINEEHPELSGIVLSLYDDDRRAQNGFLRAIDIYSMKLNNELVVLSACQTALGRDVTGEGIVGLSRAFLYAGSKSVVSSLWKIDDAASAEFMSRFYSAMLVDGKRPAVALQTAQNGMRAIPRYNDPRFWAGFTLNGDWR